MTFIWMVELDWNCAFHQSPLLHVAVDQRLIELELWELGLLELTVETAFTLTALFVCLFCFQLSASYNQWWHSRHCRSDMCVSHRSRQNSSPESATRPRGTTLLQELVSARVICPCYYCCAFHWGAVKCGCKYIFSNANRNEERRWHRAI